MILQYYEELLIEECIQEYEDALMESEGNHDSDCITIQLTSDHIVNDIYVSSHFIILIVICVCISIKVECK